MTHSKKPVSQPEDINLEPEFKGYTMEELKYQRALLALKKEFMKEKALHTATAIKEQVPLLGGKSSFAKWEPKGITGKIFKSLDFADYVMIGMQGLRIGKKISSLFKKKKS